MISVSRVIVVSETVYSELQKMKKNESFSKTIEALIKGKGSKGDISQLEGLFGSLNKKSATAWKKEVNAGRRAFGKSRFKSE